MDQPDSSRFVSFDNESLVPESWRGEPARAFNPTLARIGDGYVICYRVVQEGSDLRRFATCALDAELALVPGSVTPLSDEVTFVDQTLGERSLTWHADPRFVRLGEVLYVMWNDGANRPANHQFLAPMSDDGLHLAAPAHEITAPIRRPMEKNWAPWEVDGTVYVTYKSRPHVVLEVDLDPEETRWIAHPAYQQGFKTDFEANFGILRGGAQPVRDGDSFLVLGHSSFASAHGRTYRAAFMRFAAEHPFGVIKTSPVPFDLPNPYGREFRYERLNEEVGDVIYPCGLVADGDDWVVSYGINDERCAVARVSRAEVEESMVKATTSFTLDHVPALRKRAGLVQPTTDRRIPLFWFDARGQLFEKGLSARTFKRGNFGDIASRDVVERISGQSVAQAVDGRPTLLAIGSVLHRAQSGDVVWGAGIKGGNKPLPRGTELDVHAVRGPHSLEYLEQSGIDVSHVKETFDPGVLIPHMLADEIAEIKAQGDYRQGGNRIVPHFRDDTMMRRSYYKHLEDFVSVDATPLAMVKNLLGAERVFSSSLHGIVFAEALGIPAHWLAPIGDEDELKYHDYYLGSGRSDVKRFASLEEALRAEPMELPNFRIDDYIATFPAAAVAELCRPALRLGERINLARYADVASTGLFGLRGLRYHDHRGVWMTDRRASINTTLLAEPGTSAQVTLVLRPFNPISLKGPQQLRFQLNNGPVSAVQWAKRTRDAIEVTLEVTATGPETPLNIFIEADHKVSPRRVRQDINIPNRYSVAACLMALRVSSPDKPARGATQRLH